MKNTIVAIGVILLVLGGIYYLVNKDGSSNEPTFPESKNASNGTSSTNQNGKSDNVAVDKIKTVIGKSVDGREVVAYHFGEGEREVLFVGGIHGGYSWNTALLGRQVLAYLKTYPEVVPKNIKVTVIPVLNPDGLSKVAPAEEEFTADNVSTDEAKLMSARFNSNEVDLSRNFDCEWKSQGVWQKKAVSGGKKAFSEPESMAVKNYVESHKPVAVVVWYSSAGGVYASSCTNGPSPETKTLTEIFAKGSGYPAHNSFDFYETSGDMVNWLAKINIPAISVLLTNHKDTELQKNVNGLKAVLTHYSK